MMTKQEAIEEIKKQSTQAYDDFAIIRDTAISIVNQINELERPVVPKYVADFISSEQRSCSTLSEAIDNMDDERQILNWFYINPETFAKAWIYGYKVEKGKLYRMKHNLTNEYLCFNTKRCFHSDEIKLFPPVQRTEKEWEELGYWNNNLYVPEEVEE